MNLPDTVVRPDAAPWLALLPALLLADTAAHGLALALACVALGALLLPTLSGIRRIDRLALRWALAAVAIATAAGVVQGLGLAWRWPLFAGLDLGVALLSANLALWRFGAPFERREGPVLHDLGIAAVALVTMGAVRGAFSGVVLLAAQPLGVLLLTALALAAQQAWRQRRGGTA